MTMTPTFSSKPSRWLWLSALLVLTGCSDFLGIDQFGDQGINAGRPSIDGDDPDAENVDPDDEMMGELMWWSAFGGAGIDDGTAVAPLPEGVQLAGIVDGTVDFGGGAIGTAGSQAFAARFDLDGNHVWSIATAGMGTVERVVVDTSSDEGAVIAGSYRGELSLGQETLPEAPSGGPSLFVAWLSAQGDVTQVATFSTEKTNDEVIVNAVTVAPNRDVAIAGMLQGTLVVDPNTMLSGAPLDADALLVVLDEDGAPKLATNFRESGDTRDQHLSVATFSDDGTLWIGGSFRGPLVFANETLTSIGNSDGLVARVELGAGLQTVDVVAQLQLGGGQSVVDVTSLHVAEDVTIGGTFSERLVLAEHELDSLGEGDIFVARLSPDLLPRWTRSLGSQGPETMTALGVDDQGHTTLTGSFSSDLQDGLAVLATSNGGQDSLVTKLDEEGAVVWAQTFGRQGDDEGRGLAVDGEGHAIVVGAFVDGMALDDEILKGTGMQDIFLLRLDR